MSLREWMLYVLLAAAAGCVVRGVALLTVSGAWIVGGVLAAVLAYLLLADDSTAAADEAVE